MAALERPWPIWAWYVLAAIIGVEALWLAATPLSLAFTHLRSPAEDMVAAVMLFVAGRYWLREARARTMAQGFAFFLVSWPAVRLLSALTFSLKMPLADARLSAWDVELGFDWLRYVRWVDAHPLLLSAMDFAYGRLVDYSCAIFAVLTLFVGPKRGTEFALVVFLTGIAVAIIGAFFPALAAMTHYAPDPHLFRHVRTSFGTLHLKVMRELLADPNYAISLGRLPGMVTFPSFHTAVGVGAIFSARGRKRIFVPVLALNALMIASTPVLGSHYFVDLIAGAFLALGVAIGFRAVNGAT